jgi:hypothetical protein
MMPALLTCAGTGSTVKLDFPTAARCHMQQADGTSQAAMQQIYSRYLTGT